LFDLKNGEQVADYIQRQIDEGRIYVGVEGDEPDLPYAVKVFGNKPFMFSTDFPHEVNAELCQHEIEEICENSELSDEDKEAIMYSNANRFYGFE
jgi:predicted TIM-barrel fold metal-dependent hydrolase